MERDGGGGIAGAAPGTMSMDDRWEALLDALQGDEERQVEALALELAAEGSQVLPWLWGVLQQGSEDERWAALRVLAAMEAPPIEWFVWMLADVSPLVRGAAARALVEHPQERALPALIEALADPDALVGDLAMQALIAQGERAVPVLLQVVRDLPPAARTRAVRALASLKDVRAIPYFMETIENGSMLASYWAVRGLENLGQNLVYFLPGR